MLDWQLLVARSRRIEPARSLYSRLKRRLRRGIWMSSASRSLSVFSVSTSTTRESCRSAPAAHRYAFEADAFVLDGLDEFHEGGRAHDGDSFAHVASKIHPAQAAPQGLLRQDIALRGIGSQTDDGRDVANVPAFLEHQDRNDCLVGECPAIDLVRLPAQKLRVLPFSCRMRPLKFRRSSWCG